MPARHACASLLVAAAIAAPARAQSADPVASYARARAVLDRAVAALGGDSALAVRTMTLAYDGETVQRHQSRKPAAPYGRTPLSGRMAFDFAGGRIATEQRSEFTGGFLNHQGFLNDGRSAWILNFRRGTAGEAPPPVRTFGSAWNLLRRLPHWLVGTARERAGTLRWAGTADVGGRPHDAIAFATADGRLVTLYVDRATGLPDAAGLVVADAVTGDAEERMVFDGWTRVAGLMVPSARRVVRGGETVEEIRQTVTVNEPLADSLFVLPAGLRRDTSVAAPQRMELRPLAPGVHLLVAVAGSNSLVVELDEGLAVVEPYGDDATSRAALAELAKALPGKPVRWIVATHHHDDHSGGVRAYLAAGATLVTTRGNRAFFERMAKARGSVPPDVAEVAGAPRLELVAGRRTLGTGRALELIDIGPAPPPA